MSIADWTPRSFSGRLATAIASAAVSAVVFLAIHARFGYQPVALTAVPLVVWGLLFGVRGGLIAWLLLVPFNILLSMAAGLGTNPFGGEAPVRLLVALMVGVLVGRLRDLTAALRREAANRKEETLQRSKAEAQLRLTLTAVPDLMFRIARDGTFLDFHAGNPDDLFVPADRIRGGKVAELMPPAFSDQILASVKKTLDTGAAQLTEFQLPMPRGTQDFEARMVVSAPDEVLTIVRNVTERKRLEDVLRQRDRERLEATMKDQLVLADHRAALGTLAAGAAHEINNPLAYVIANLGFLGRQFQELVAGATPDSVRLERQRLAEIQEVVRETSEGAERVRVIVRDLKSFSRTDEDRSDLVDVRVQLESAINMARKELSPRATLVRDYGEVAPVRANPVRIGQVFLNVLINAAQAIPSGAASRNAIRVVARMEEAGIVLVEIHDTGVGMAPEVIEHIFDPFFTTKEIGRGTGLGLYTCRNVVDALGGSISVESTVGKGSVFRLRLPASLSNRVEPPPLAKPDLAGNRRGHVLVIDDEPNIGRAIRLILAAEHDVSVSASGTEALARLEAGERFDVILCDLLMPEMTGADLYRELSRRAPEQRDRVVFLSGGAVSAAMSDFLREVPNTQLDKPFEPERLLALVRERVGA